MKEIDFAQLITKEVLSNDKKQMGHVDGLDDTYLIVKDGLVSPSYLKYLEEKWMATKTGKYCLTFLNKI